MINEGGEGDGTTALQCGQQRRDVRVLLDPPHKFDVMIHHL